MKKGDVVYFGVFGEKVGEEDDYVVFKAVVESSCMGEYKGRGIVEKWIAKANEHMRPHPSIYFCLCDEYKISLDGERGENILWGRNRELVDKMCKYKIREKNRAKNGTNLYDGEPRFGEKTWFGRIYTDEEVGAIEDVSVREEILGHCGEDYSLGGYPCFVFEKEDGYNLANGKASTFEYDVKGWESDGKSWPGYKYFSCWGKDREEVETRLKAQREKLIGEAVDRMDDEERKIEERKKVLKEFRERNRS